ncbi:RagB/SusD family nutrient uptake outer membrane protein [Labilibaculum sp. K2S]|uniref:RagB/SusD family nutrient uptake outer membrane protein n=1 Tax=Labilibaculum sp. K2S TaxID=3056386 RepID=UPI0025A4BE69|nr:RagB/SusD family nutrient uptake outer membrane protein [Labilibaculum sp. K2S]MDM8159531.1 RagB/SusD family nutrient uptake outer membrane protein [Labilibaculum sp. K2S]
MKNRIYKIAIVLFSLFTYWGCSSDFLELEPTGKLASEEYLTTEKEAFDALIGLYDRMQVNNNNQEDWCSVFLTRVLLSDDSNAGGGSATDQQKFQEIDDYNQRADNAVVKNVWKGYYKAINMANNIIDNVPTELASAETIIAEAKFVRAYNYFELVTLFGSIPLRLENPKTEADNHVAKSSVEAIYAQIELDLTAAVASLPLKSTYSDAYKFRASKGAAQALLGKAQLFQKKYAEAATNFAAVISSEEYDLEDNYGEIYDGVAKAGKEVVFEILYSSESGNNWDTWDGTGESNYMTILMGIRGDWSFNNLDIALGKEYINGWGMNVPTKEIGELFDASAANGDVRSAASVMSGADFSAAGGYINSPEAAAIYTDDNDDYKSPGTFNWDDYEGYLRLKYTCDTLETGKPAFETNWQFPVKVIRYADVLLMAAEAYLESSQAGKALIEINKVRTRANLPNLSSVSLQNIKDERRLELAFEGHRFFDCVRWGDTSELGPKFTAGKNEVLPIPQIEIDLNNKLSQADQNPGY